VVVGHLYLETVAILPYETKTILIIDSYTMLAFAIASQSFQPVARRYLKLHQSPHIIEHTKLPTNSHLHIHRNMPYLNTSPNTFRFLRQEGTYHDEIVSLGVTIVKPPKDTIEDHNSVRGTAL
jgi:hypothetical protein